MLDSLGWFDGIFRSELDGGSYRMDNGVDSVTVHVLPGVPDPPPTASTPPPTFAVALNGSAPVVLEWLEFNAESGPLAQRQAARSLVLLISLFDDAVPALLLAEGRTYTSITNVPEASNCDGYRPGADPPPGLPARGSVTVSRTADPNNGHAGNFDFGFADCPRIHDSIFSDGDRLYRGNMATTGWINTVDASNVLTNFGFESASFARLRVNSLLTQNPTLILEPGLTLDGEFGLVFFPP